MDTIITSDDILGKDAIDLEGEILGVITKLHIDKTKKTLTGVTLDQGFMKPNMFIGIDHIKNFGVDSVFVDRVPISKLKGKKVISNEGKQLGCVIDVAQRNEKLYSILIAKNKHSKTKHFVSEKDIQSISSQILLKEKASLLDTNTMSEKN